MFAHARMCPVLLLVSYLIHSTGGGALKNDDTMNLILEDLPIKERPHCTVVLICKYKDIQSKNGNTDAESTTLCQLLRP